MTIKFKKLTDKAIQPVRATNSGAGYNLTAVSATTEVNERGQMILVYHTNLSVEIPEGLFVPATLSVLRHCACVIHLA